MYINPVLRRDDTRWDGPPGPGAEADIEAGKLLFMPELAFGLLPAEQRFLDPAYADPAAKNINLRAGEDEIRGARGTPEEQQAIGAMLRRFRSQAEALVTRLFPYYAGKLRLANTSFRPVAIEGRVSSWRKDDTRLHVDAFPSNPTQGVRLLRVFSNVHPAGGARVWRVGEPFDDFARRHIDQIQPALPGSAWLLQKLHVTKRRRTAYDHLMLHLHDRAKADLNWQQTSPQQRMEFPPGSTWVVFTDQVLHAAMAGQFAFEQTFTLAPEDQLDPGTAPLHVLERMTGRDLGRALSA